MKVTDEHDTPTLELIVDCNGNGWQTLDQQNWNKSPQIVTTYAANHGRFASPRV
jgi:hypothetical protein